MKSLRVQRTSVRAKSRVLCFGKVKALTKRRSEYLRKQGYQVDEASELTEAKALLARFSYNCLIVGHRVPTEERDFLTALAKKAATSSAIFLYKGCIYKAERADAILNVDCELSDLAQTIEFLKQRIQAK